MISPLLKSGNSLLMKSSTAFMKNERIDLNRKNVINIENFALLKILFTWPALTMSIIRRGRLSCDTKSSKDLAPTT